MFENKERSTWELGMGKLEGREVEMQYNKDSKILRISCDGISYTHWNENWP